MKEDIYFHVAVAGTEGVTLFTDRAAENVENKRLWQFMKLNDDLELGWNINLLADKNYFFYNSKSFNADIFYLFEDGMTNNILILKVDSNTGKVNRIIIQNDIPVLIDHYEVTQKGIIIAGTSGDKPVILFYDKELSTPAFANSAVGNDGAINDLQVYPDGSFDVLVSNYGGGMESALNVHSFEASGIWKKSQSVISKDQRILQDGRVTIIDDKNVVAGTYGSSFGGPSLGFFIAKLQNNNSQIDYYPFSTFLSMFNHFNDYKKERIKRKLLSSKLEGKYYKHRAKVQINDLLPYNDHHVLIAEQYSTAQVSPRYSDGVNVYDPVYRYKFKNAVVLAINEEGRIIWDKGIELNGSESYVLAPVVKALPLFDKMPVFFTDSEKIVNKTILLDAVDSAYQINSTPLQVNEPQYEIYDENKKYLNSGLFNRWDKSYYGYGFQTLINPKTGETKKVFFINKMNYN